MERITGDTIDISKWTDFCYYELFQYWDKQDLEENPRIVRWIGVSQRVERMLCYWILKVKGKVIAKENVQHATKDKAATDDFRRSIGYYHKFFAEAFGQGDYYASDLDGLELFTNDDVPYPYDTY